MTANELADELAFKHIAGDDNGAFSSKIITMLRQQQAEIEALKLRELTDEEIIKVYEDILGVAFAKGSAIEFVRAILRKAQEPLGEKFEKVLNDNLWEMLEPTDPYERGFIDGMAKQRDSAVQRFVEGGTPDPELAEHKRIIREQQAEIEALKEELKRYADAIGEERGNKALRKHEIGKILTKVLDDCGLLKKVSEK